MADFQVSKMFWTKLCHNQFFDANPKKPTELIFFLCFVLSLSRIWILIYLSTGICLYSSMGQWASESQQGLETAAVWCWMQPLAFKKLSHCWFSWNSLIHWNCTLLVSNTLAKNLFLTFNDVFQQFFKIGLWNFFLTRKNWLLVFDFSMSQVILLLSQPPSLYICVKKLCPA